MFRTIDTALWTDPKVRSLDADAKLLFLYCITNTHTHVGGIYYLPAIVVSYETGIPPEKLDTLWDTLSGACLVKRDQENEVIWVVNMLRYQGRGPRVFRGVANHLATLHKCCLLQEFLATYPGVKRLCKHTLSKPYADHARDCPKEQEQDKEQESKDILPASPAAAVNGTHQGPARQRDQLFDAIAEVTGFDPSVKAQGSLVGKVAASLRKAGYTPDEVRHLPAAVEAGGLSITLTPSAVEKYIGWVRNPPTRTSAPTRAGPSRASAADYFGTGEGD